MGPPFHLVEAAAQWGEEGIAGGGDPAAEDHDLRIDGVDDGGDPGGEALNGAQPDLGSHSVASEMSRDQIPGAGEAAGGTGGESAVADCVFEASGGAGDIGRAVGVGGDVA